MNTGPSLSGTPQREACSWNSLTRGECGGRREVPQVKGTRLHTMRRMPCPLVDVQPTGITAASSGNSRSLTKKGPELPWRTPAGRATFSHGVRGGECEAVR
jgi:hypothetical protein